jgi:hypothetical protein
MGRFTAAIAMIVIVVVAIPARASAVEVTAVDLIDDGERYDGMTVSVVGELIGDYGNRRDGFTWTQLNQDPYVADPIVEGGPPLGGNIGIGVRIPSELLDGADPPGRYRQTGPVVSLTGIWRYHDPDRQGESFLDVEALDLVRPGQALSEATDWWAIAGGLLLVLAAAAMLLLHRRAGRRH